jgi:MtN3 and saliva related transmembrane protein
LAENLLAVAAASWGVLMGLSPVLQIRRMLTERSSRDLSVGYFLILLVGFLLWICYGIVARNPVLIVPNSISFVAGAVTVLVALRLRPGVLPRAEVAARPRFSARPGTCRAGHPGHRCPGSYRPRRGTRAST